MKNKLLILLKTNINNSFKLSTLTKKKLLLYIILGIYLFGACGYTIYLLLNGFFETLQTINMEEVFIPLLFAFAALMALIFTIFSAKAWLFENKDNDLLLALPIKRSTILLNRLLYLSMLNFVIGLVVFIPGLIIYISSVSCGIIFYISVLIMILFFSIIPTIVASLFGYLIAYITSKVERKNIVELVCYIIFIATYLALYYNVNGILTFLAKNPDIMNNVLKIGFLPIYLIGKAISTHNLLYIIGFIALNIFIIYIFVLVLNKSYFSIISKLDSHKTKRNFTMHELKTESKTSALIKKELNRYFNSAIYVFNTLFGMIFLLIAAIGSLFFSPEKIMALLGSEITLSSFMLVFIGTLFTTAFTVTTSCSISLEHNNFWIIKMLPVNVKDIFKAKLFVNRIIVIPVVIICELLFVISGYITFTEMIFISIFAIIINLFVSNFGLIADLLFPRFDAINDTVNVKQSVSSMMGLLVPMFTFIALIAFLLCIDISNMACILIAASFGSVLYIITTVILNTWGIKRFNKIG